jgi:dihydropteroate synthase
LKYLPGVISINGRAQAHAELEAIGVHGHGIGIMAPKGVFRVIKVVGLKTVAANILKQEMLSYGGEAAVAHGAIDLSVPTTDVIIFGTEAQFKKLIKKLKDHQFDLPCLADEIKTVLSSYAHHPSPMKIGNKTFAFGKKTHIMGILNVTPDSFSDGGKFISIDDAVLHALGMQEDGADIIDIGGESTRPGAALVREADELSRVIPVIKKLRKLLKVPISIDTRRAKVAEKAIAAGADMINDVSGLRADRRMAKVAARCKVPLVMMHMTGTPATMQSDPKYKDLFGEMLAYFEKGIRIAEIAGLKKEKLILDPGLGFGKTLKHNLLLIRHLDRFKSLGRPILAGPSRKSLIGHVLDLPVDQRLEGTIAAVTAAVMCGADIVRVHDVREIKRAVMMADSIKKEG